MAFISALIPELLEDMKDWEGPEENPGVYRALKSVMRDPAVKDLFERGEVFFNDASRGTAIVISRTLKEETGGLEQKRHVVIPIHFAKTPYNKDEGKVWFGIGSISTLGLLPEMIYQARDLILGQVYEKHTLSALLKEGWRTGIPVVRRKDPAGIRQPGWRFQVLQMVPVGVNRSELRAGAVEISDAAIASAADVAETPIVVPNVAAVPLRAEARSGREQLSVEQTRKMFNQIYAQSILTMKNGAGLSIRKSIAVPERLLTVSFRADYIREQQPFITKAVQVRSPPGRRFLPI